MPATTQERIRALAQRIAEWSGIERRIDLGLGTVVFLAYNNASRQLLDYPDDVRAELHALIQEGLPREEVWEVVTGLANDARLTTEMAVALLPRARGHNTAMGDLLRNPAVPEEAVLAELDIDYPFGIATFAVQRHTPLSPALTRRLVEILGAKRGQDVAPLLARPDVGADVVLEFLTSSGTRSREVLTTVARREDLRTHPEIRSFLLSRLAVRGVAAALAADLRPEEFVRIYGALVKQRDHESADAYVEQITATGKLSLDPAELARLFAGGELSLRAMELLRHMEPRARTEPKKKRGRSR